MTIFNNKLSLQGLSAALFKRKTPTRYFVEVDHVVEIGKKMATIEIEGVTVVIPNEKLVAVEERNE